MLLGKIARHLGAIAGLVLLGGLLSATLVRLAPVSMPTSANSTPA